MKRSEHDSMEYYRHVYKNSQTWKGEALRDKTLIVYCEQGYGDIIQFLRYVPAIQKYGNSKIYLHIPIEMHSLIESQNWGVYLINKHSPEIPNHDFHILSMDLPSLFSFLIPQQPYLQAPPHPEIEEYKKETNKKLMGICWESQSNIEDKNIPLSLFEEYKDNFDIFNLNFKIQDTSLIENCSDFLFGVEIHDWLDTAKVISALDIIISIDTGVLHLAGAMGKETYGILKENYDARWGPQKCEKTIWYSSMNLYYFNGEDKLNILIKE